MTWILIGLAMAGLGLGYILYKNHIIQVAQENTRLELELKNVVNRNIQLRYDIDKLKAPQELQRKIQSMGLVKITELKVYTMDNLSGTRIARGPLPEGKLR